MGVGKACNDFKRIFPLLGVVRELIQPVDGLLTCVGCARTNTASPLYGVVCCVWRPNTNRSCFYLCSIWRLAFRLMEHLIVQFLSRHCGGMIFFKRSVHERFAAM